MSKQTILENGSPRIYWLALTFIIAFLLMIILGHWAQNNDTLYNQFKGAKEIDAKQARQLLTDTNVTGIKIVVFGEAPLGLGVTASEKHQYYRITENIWYDEKLDELIPTTVHLSHTVSIPSFILTYFLTRNLLFVALWHIIYTSLTALLIRKFHIRPSVFLTNVGTV